MKITLRNKITDEINENPTLLYRNGKFVLTMEEISEGTYEARQWLDIYEISNDLEDAYSGAVSDYETAVIELHKEKELNEHIENTTKD